MLELTGLARQKIPRCQALGYVSYLMQSLSFVKLLAKLNWNLLAGGRRQASC